MTRGQPTQALVGNACKLLSKNPGWCRWSYERLSEKFGVGQNTLRYSALWQPVRALIGETYGRWSEIETRVAAASAALFSHPEYCWLSVAGIATKLSVSVLTLRTSTEWKRVRDAFEEVTGQPWPSAGRRWPPSGRAEKALQRLRLEPGLARSTKRQLAASLSVSIPTLLRGPSWHQVRDECARQSGRPWSDVGGRRSIEQNRATAAAGILATNPDWCHLTIPRLAKNLDVVVKTLRHVPSWKVVRDTWQKITGRAWPRGNEHWPRPEARVLNSVAKVASRESWTVSSLARALHVHDQTLRHAPIWKPVRDVALKTNGRRIGNGRWTSLQDRARHAAAFLHSQPELCQLPFRQLASALHFNASKLLHAPELEIVRAAWTRVTGEPWPSRRGERRVNKALLGLSQIKDWRYLTIPQLARQLGVPVNVLGYSEIWKPVHDARLARPSVREQEALAKRSQERRIHYAVKLLTNEPSLTTLPIQALSRRLRVNEERLRTSAEWIPLRACWQQITGRPWPDLARRPARQPTNEDRNQWCWARWQTGYTLRQIFAGVRDRPLWEPFDSALSVRSAIHAYARKYTLPVRSGLSVAPLDLAKRSPPANFLIAPLAG
jgi:hypothetical protein